MSSCTEEQPSLTLVFRKDSWGQLCRHSGIILRHHEFHNHLLGRAGNFISSTLRMNVGVFFEHSSFFSTEYLGVYLLESILRDSLPTISVKEATEQLRKKNPGDII